MAKFFIDYQAWTEIEADTIEEAKKKFWRKVYNGIPCRGAEIDSWEMEEEEDVE